MANTKYLGNKINLYKDQSVTLTPDWMLVACLTDSDIDSTRETIDAGSKCGPDQLAGTKTDTVNATGFFIIDTDADQISLNELAISYDSGDSGHWKFEDEDGGTTYYREFNGPILSFNESLNQNEPVTFTLSIGVKGDIIRTLPTT